MPTARPPSAAVTATTILFSRKRFRSPIFRPTKSRSGLPTTRSICRANTETKGPQASAAPFVFPARTHSDQQETTMHIETIALSKLVPSPANVRKAKTDVAGLAASIMAHGLLQNLQVCANGGNYEVVAGGRRLAALKYLAKQKKIAADYAVACEVRDGPDAVEISLTEN